MPIRIRSLLFYCMWQISAGCWLQIIINTGRVKSCFALPVRFAIQVQRYQPLEQTSWYISEFCINRMVFFAMNLLVFTLNQGEKFMVKCPSQGQNRAIEHQL